MSESRIIRITEVMNKTGLKRTTIYKRMKAGDFPEAVSLGANAVGWHEQEIDAWIAALSRRKAA